MKISLLFFTLCLSLSASAAELKAGYGTIARCHENADLGNRAYRMEIFKSQLSKVSKIYDLRIMMLVCQKVDSKFLHLSTPFNSSISKRYYDDDTSSVKELNSKIHGLKLAAYTEAGKLLSINELQNVDTDIIQTKIEVPLLESIDQVILRLNGTETIIIPGNEKPYVDHFLGGIYLLNL